MKRCVDYEMLDVNPETGKYSVEECG